MKSFLSLMFSFIVLMMNVFAQPSITIPFVESYNFSRVSVQVDVRCNNVKSYAMNKDHFTIFEDGKRIDNFSLKCPDTTDVCCISVGIVMDGGGSMNWGDPNKYVALQQAASMFVRGMNGYCDYGTVIGSHSDKIEIFCPWTRDTSKLQNSIFTQINVGGSNYNNEAVLRAIQQFQADASSECRAVILVTNMQDNSSIISPDSCAAYARKRGVRIFTIDPERIHWTDSTLLILAEKTGGKVFFTYGTTDLTPVFLELRKSIQRHFDMCQLQYESTCGDGLPKTLQVTLGKPNAFCNDSVKTQFMYTPPIDSNSTTRLHIDVVPTTIDTNTITQIPIRMSVSSDSVEMFLENFNILYDTKTIEVQKIITDGTALQNTAYQLQPISNGVRVILSERKLVKIPTLFCILEVKSTSQPKPTTNLKLQSDSMRARCHNIQFKDGLIKIRQLTKIEEHIPSSIYVSQCYPNPVGTNFESPSNTTSIQFSLQSNEHIRAVLYDQLGRVVKVLIDEIFEEGTHNLQIETHSLAAGRYNLVFEFGKSSVHREFVVVK